MKNNVKKRNELIKELVEYKLSRADFTERELMINNNWGLSQYEFEISDYPQELKEEMLNYYWSQHDVMSEFYDPLIRKVIADELSEETNLKLIEMYLNFTGKRIEIIDKEVKVSEEFYQCPCCHNKTLSERGQYYICPVCDWEDDGIDGDHLSHCNGMTLSEAQRAFCESGSIY